MKILVVGGSGVISSYVVRFLLKTGEHTVCCISRDINSFDRDIRENSNFRHVQADIYQYNKYKDVYSCLEEVLWDVVIDFIAYNQMDIERDFFLFNKTKQYIFISSASVYQKPVRDFYITESTPKINPFWKYSQEKISAERRLFELYEQKGFPITIVRLHQTYSEKTCPVAIRGKRGNLGTWTVLQRMLNNDKVIIPGDGNSLWTLTHASDVAQGIVGLMGNSKTIGSDFHITSDESITWNQIYDYIADALGVECHKFHVSTDLLVDYNNIYYAAGTNAVRGDTSHSVKFDNTKIKRYVPDFCCKIRCEVGIERSVKYILEHEDLQKWDDEFNTWCNNVIACIESSKDIFRQLYKG